MTQETVLFYAAIAAAVCVPIAIALLFFRFTRPPKALTDAGGYGAGDCASQMTSEDVDRKVESN